MSTGATSTGDAANPVDLDAHEVPVNEVFRRLSTAYFLETVAPGSRVLDCGCGDGAVSLPLADRGCEVEAFDLRAERIDLLNSLRGDRPITARVADFWELPFDAGSFDYVVSRQFVSAFEDWRAVLDEKLRLTKPGGKVAFQQNSEDSRVTAAQWATDPGKARRILQTRPAYGDDRPTAANLAAFCEERGCRLERLTPMTFFLPRAPLFRAAMSSAAMDAYGEELARRMREPSVYEFVRWFERDVLSRLSPALASMVFVAFEKPAR